MLSSISGEGRNFTHAVTHNLGCWIESISAPVFFIIIILYKCCGLCAKSVLLRQKKRPFCICFGAQKNRIFILGVVLFSCSSGKYWAHLFAIWIVPCVIMFWIFLSKTAKHGISWNCYFISLALSVSLSLFLCVCNRVYTVCVWMDFCVNTFS